MIDDDIRSYLTDEDREEIAQEAFAKGVEQGIEQGIAQGIARVARQLKAEGGVSIQTIASATGLTAEEIEAL